MASTIDFCDFFVNGEYRILKYDFERITVTMDDANSDGKF